MSQFLRIFCFIFFVFVSVVRAEHEPVLSSYLLVNPDVKTLKQVVDRFSVDHREGKNYEVIVPVKEVSAFLKIAPRARLMDQDIAASTRAKLLSFKKMSRSGLEVLENHYHSLFEVQNWMWNLSYSHPKLVKTVVYGKSGGRRPLMALKLASGEGKPVAILTAATHGDELITTEVLMALVNELVDQYGVDERLTKIIDGHELYFIPVVNPDGFAGGSRYEGNTDPNRSYPWPGHEDKTPTPSIAAVMAFFESLPVKASIDFHAHGELVMYPWAYTHEPVHPTMHAQFDALTRSMTEVNHYTYGSISDVIYIAPGSSADYYFWKKGSLSLGIEIGKSKIPLPSKIPAAVESQRESTWRFLEAI